MLKNGVGRYNIFFFILHKACWILLFVSFSCRIRQCFCSSTIRFVPCAHFLHQQTISHMSKRFSEWVHCSTAISIKHQILATFNTKKKFNMYFEEGIIFFFFYFFTIHSHIWSSAFQILAFDHAYHFYMPLCYYWICIQDFASLLHLTCYFN